MGYPTNIEWTDATWNPVGGCTIKSPGCINCYAQTLAGGPRLRNHPLYAGVTDQVKGKSVFNGKMTALVDDHDGWTWPLRWRGAAEPKLGTGKPSLIFVGDMADLFHENRILQYIDRTIATIMLSPHVGQLLTKRADVMARYFSDASAWTRIFRDMWRIQKIRKWKDVRDPEEQCGFPHPRLWLGCSAERQPEANERLPHLRRFAEAGWQTFISIEPMLGPIMLPTWLSQVSQKPWVIVGGESGPNARPMNPLWAKEIRYQAECFGLPFFFKQWGEWSITAPAGVRSQPMPGRKTSDFPMMFCVGKKKSGRLLDGREHSDFPVVA